MENTAYVQQLERQLRLTRKRADAVQDANIVLTVVCIALVLALAIMSNPI